MESNFPNCTPYKSVIHILVNLVSTLFILLLISAKWQMGLTEFSTWFFVANADNSLKGWATHNKNKSKGQSNKAIIIGAIKMNSCRWLFKHWKDRQSATRYVIVLSISWRYKNGKIWDTHDEEHKNYHKKKHIQISTKPSRWYYDWAIMGKASNQNVSIYLDHALDQFTLDVFSIVQEH